jgi:hypothetical protein
MKSLEIRNADAADLLLNVGTSADGWEKLELWHPIDPKNFRFVITVAVGMAEQKGENYFSLEIQSKGYQDQRKARWQRKYCLEVKKYDWDHIKKLIVKRVERCNRGTWDASVECLRQKFYWEYEEEAPTVEPLEPLPNFVFAWRKDGENSH